MLGRQKASWIMVSVLLLAILTLAAQCGRSDEAEGVPAATPAPAVKVEPTEDTRLEIFYGSFLGGETNRNPEQQIINQFEASHPDINISRFPMEIAPETVMSYLERIPFTVVMTAWADHNIFAAMEAGRFLDLSQLWADVNLRQAYPETFRAMGEYDGKTYFLPVFYSWYALYYNREVFETYDLRPPETWNEFLLLCETLREQGITPLVYSGDHTSLTTVWFDYLDMRLNGPAFHAALMRGEESFDDPRVRAVFETWAFLVESGYVVPEAWGFGLTQSRDMVLNKRAGMILLDGSQAREEFDFFRFPIIDPALPRGEVVPTIGYVVPADVAHPVEAMEWLAYLASAEAQGAMTAQLRQAGGGLPVHQGVDEQVFDQAMRQGRALVQGADTIRPPYFQSFEAAMTVPIVGAFRNIVRGQDYEEDLLRLEEERQKLFGE